MSASEAAVSGPGVATRRAATTAVVDVSGGARTATALADALAANEFEERDRAFVTELVNGTVRMRRACDYLIDKHVNRTPDTEVRAALRIGTYQLVFLGTQPHAAVSATVASVAPKVRGFVNAILRRVSEDVAAGGEWPSLGVEISYPDWLVDRLIDELGELDAIEALKAMNVGEQPRPRPDGYVQGASSLAVVVEVDAGPGDLVIDLCAAPGGKATALTGAGATVVALEIGADRSELLRSVCDRWGQQRAHTVRADATIPPIRPGMADRVVVDAPCTGWGALGRRSDARWRARPGDADRLSKLQTRLLGAAAELVRPGGLLIYSVCTITRAETTAVAADFGSNEAEFEPADLVSEGTWRAHGSGGLLLPQDRGSDGMAVFRWQRGS